jgi:uncharacterized membrane protein YgcG
MSRNSRVRDRGYVSSHVSIPAATYTILLLLIFLLLLVAGAGGFWLWQVVVVLADCVAQLQQRVVVAVFRVSVIACTWYELTVTVGAGGSAGATGISKLFGTNGNNSVFSTITSTGGGGGGSANSSDKRW